MAQSATFHVGGGKIYFPGSSVASDVASGCCIRMLHQMLHQMLHRDVAFWMRLFAAWPHQRTCQSSARTLQQTSRPVSPPLLGRRCEQRCVGWMHEVGPHVLLCVLLAMEEPQRTSSSGAKDPSRAGSRKNLLLGTMTSYLPPRSPPTPWDMKGGANA